MKTRATCLLLAALAALAGLGRALPLLLHVTDAPRAISWAGDLPLAAPGAGQSRAGTLGRWDAGTMAQSAGISRTLGRVIVGQAACCQLPAARFRTCRMGPMLRAGMVVGSHKRASVG